MAETMEKHLINIEAYDGIIIRRRTVDDCVSEMEFLKDREDLITPHITYPLKPGVKRLYRYQGVRLEQRGEKRWLVADYREELKATEI